MALHSHAEQRALTATALESFPINLEEIRRSVTDILAQFGKSLIFNEYTTHDISHIDDMLKTLDWLIPERTREHLSAGEWLMLVLSIYFHDMGLIVTEDEFASRNISDFNRFCEETLFAPLKTARIIERKQTYLIRPSEIDFIIKNLFGLTMLDVFAPGSKVDQALSSGMRQSKSRR
jgi:hypothetical protein